MLNTAFVVWRTELGEDRVLDTAQAMKQYGDSTLGGEPSTIRGALLPESVAHVISIMKIAAEYKTPLYPISTGKNWGYGSARPVMPSIIVDLSGMNRILSISEELGLVTVEPGVTSGQLQAQLEKKGIPFLAPISGAGKRCSIIGNLLEHGRGSNAFVDRFASLAGIEAVLADGTLYQSSSGGTSSVHGFHKWGTGPYLDGIFGQSNMVIVVNATIKLAPVPEYTQGFLLCVKDDRSLSELINAARTALQKLGSTLPSIIIQNAQRTLTRTTPYSKEHVDVSGTLSDSFVKNSLKSLGLTQWTVLGVLQGERGMVRAAHGVVKDIFRTFAVRAFFFDEKSLEELKFLNRNFLLPRRLKISLAVAPMLHSFLAHSLGKGVGKIETARRKPFPYWKSASASSVVAPVISRTSDYDLDPHGGLLFFSAVLPACGANVEPFVLAAESICRKNGLEPILGLLNFSDTSLFVSLPLLFDKANAKETSAVQNCYEELRAELLKCGGYIHRANINTMKMSANQDSTFWQVVGKIKKTLDPLNIISPGRYNS